MAKAFALLTIYHFLFFWQAYSQPFTLARSELLSTFFPSWIRQGRSWLKWRIPKYDPYYWLNSHSHPVLSSYYPPQAISSLLGANMGLDDAFLLYLGVLLGHFVFASIGWYVVILLWSNQLVALFGAITLTYSAYNIKQQPCFAYTITWFPWLLTGIASHNILLTGISFGMILLAGYYPIGIQATLIAVGASVLWDIPLSWLPIGLLIGSPQLIPFLSYLPKTIRTKKVSSIGKVPWWHPISLLFPKLFRNYINGVGYWEMAYYVGITPLIIIASSSAATIISQAWILGVVSYFLMIGVGAKFLPRIPARWCFTFQFALGWCAANGLTNLHLSGKVMVCLIILQALDLFYHNSDLIPTHPYSELPRRPSWAFNTPLTRYLEKYLGNERVSGLPYPLFTGHINRLRTLGYSGGMQLKLMSRWRNDLNPDGAGEHDFFRRNLDDGRLSRSRVKFAYTRSRIDWEPTPIKYLYKNPDYN